MNQKSFILYVLLIYGVFNFGNLVVQEFRLQNYLTRLDVDMQEVKDKQSQLQQSLNYYQTNMGIEELARKRLGYYKEDEISIRLIKALPKP